MALSQRTRKISLHVLAVLVVSVPLVVFFQNCAGTQMDFAGGFASSSDNSLLSAPVISFTQEIPDTVNTATVSARFEVSGSVQTVSCQLNNQAVQDCSSGILTYPDLIDGDYTLSVTAVSRGGVTSAQRRVFRKDTTVPLVTVAMMPPIISGSTSATFIFSATDNLSGIAFIDCSLDNATFAVCPPSPVGLTGLSPGPHGYRIRATDRAGNVSQIYSYSWTVDLSVPSLAITARPNNVTNQLTASFSFSGTGIVSYQCSLDNAAFSACTSPRNLTALPVGSRNFRVQGTNAAGTLSAPVSYTWIIDVTAPSSPLIAANIPTTTNLTTASFNFSSTDASGINSYQCSLDNSAFATCTSPRTLTGLSDGNHSFRVQSSDAAGNLSAISSFAFQVDATPPALIFTQAPVNSSNTTATIAFSATDAGTGINTLQCSLDNVAFAACTSPQTLSGLTAMPHSFRVQARDVAGNVTMIAHSWTVTAVTVPPVPTPTPTPAPPPSGSGPFLYFSDCQAGSMSGCVPGNDANPGTMASPKRSPASVDLDAVAGGTQILFKRGGAWTANFQINNPRTSAAAPLTFASYGTGEKPIINGYFEFGQFQDTLNDGGYVFRDLVLNGPGNNENIFGIWLRDSVHDVIIDNVEVRGYGLGIHAQGDSAPGVQRLTVRNSYIHRNLVQGIHGKAGDSLYENNLIERNNGVSGSNRNHGMYLSGGNNVVVRNNRFIRNSINAATGVCEGGNMTFHGNMDRLLVEGNLIEHDRGGCYGISITAGYFTPESFTNTVVRNNTIVNTGACAICISAAPGITIEANRVINSQGDPGQTGVQIPASGGGDSPGDAVTANAIVRDNVLCGLGTVVRVGTFAAINTGNIQRLGADATTGVCAR